MYHEDCSDYCGLFGIYQQPMLMLKDLPLVKNVLESGTHHFIDRYSGMAQKTRDRVFSRGLTQLMGAEWKANRDMISPAFTKEVSKTFYKMMEGDAEKLLSYVADRLRASRTSKLNIKEILSYYLLHVLTSTVFGSKPMSFDIQDVNIALQDLASVSYETLYRRIMYIIAPRLCSILRLKYSTLSYERLEAMAQKAVHDRLNSKHKLHIIDHFMGLVGNETSGFRKFLSFLIQ